MARICLKESKILTKDEIKIMCYVLFLVNTYQMTRFCIKCNVFLKNYVLEYVWICAGLNVLENFRPMLKQDKSGVFCIGYGESGSVSWR